MTSALNGCGNSDTQSSRSSQIKEGAVDTLTAPASAADLMKGNLYSSPSTDRQLDQLLDASVSTDKAKEVARVASAAGRKVNYTAWRDEVAFVRDIISTLAHPHPTSGAERRETFELYASELHDALAAHWRNALAAKRGEWELAGSADAVEFADTFAEFLGPSVPFPTLKNVQPYISKGAKELARNRRFEAWLAHAIMVINEALVRYEKARPASAYQVWVSKTQSPSGSAVFSLNFFDAHQLPDFPGLSSQLFTFTRQATDPTGPRAYFLDVDAYRTMQQIERSVYDERKTIEFAAASASRQVEITGNRRELSEFEQPRWYNAYHERVLAVWSTSLFRARYRLGTFRLTSSRANRPSLSIGAYECRKTFSVSEPERIWPRLLARVVSGFMSGTVPDDDGNRSIMLSLVGKSPGGPAETAELLRRVLDEAAAWCKLNDVPLTRNDLAALLTEHESPFNQRSTPLHLLGWKAQCDRATLRLLFNAAVDHLPDPTTNDVHPEFDCTESDATNLLWEPRPWSDTQP